MKKRGFTLIELLAVIVVLAIIALIATPIVMNVIENSKKGAAERSVANLEHAAEVYYYNNKFEGGFKGITFICNNGKCSSNDKTLQINGTAPESGSITIAKDGTINLNSIEIKGYVCSKENEKYNCNKATKMSAETTDTILTLDSKKTQLSNYRIYGNKDAGVGNKVSINGETKYEIPIKVTGKNLLDINNPIYSSNSAYSVKNKPRFNDDGSITFGGKYGDRSGAGVTIKIPEGQKFTVSWAHVSGSYTPGCISGTDIVDEVLQNYQYLNSTLKDNSITYTQASGKKFIAFSTIDSSVYYAHSIKNLQIELGNTATSYEPYTGSAYSIYLDEPLRCVDDVCDYIDFISRKVVRNVKLESNGTLVKLEESISEDIELPIININKGISNIFVETDVNPSKIEVEYYE